MNPQVIVRKKGRPFITMLTSPTTTSAANGRPPNSQLPDSDTPAQPTSTTPPANPSQRPSNAQRPASESAPPSHRIPIFEYQWGDELVGQLVELPPRSNFGGKFAIIADPSVDNAMRAQVFADQLRSQGVPISGIHFASRTQGTLHTHTLVFPCKCEDKCSGRFLISVGDDTTHPYGVPGQRIGVALYHPSSG
ncbi:hypothetical protein V8E53_007113 [Lactarius tabidus]